MQAKNGWCEYMGQCGSSVTGTLHERYAAQYLRVCSPAAAGLIVSVQSAHAEAIRSVFAGCVQCAVVAVAVAVVSSCADLLSLF